MKRKIMKTYHNAIGALLVPALRLYGCDAHDLSKTIWEKPPTGSVAPLY